MARSYKELSFGFVIIAPEHNIGLIKGTIRSIKNNYGSIPISCVVGENTSPSVLKELREVCFTYMGGTTITSLLNVAFSAGEGDWNIVVMEGTWMRRNIHQKFSYWIDGEQDVVYPVVTDYNREGLPVKVYGDFEEATLNGLCINKHFFKKIGGFSDNPIELSKKMWALAAAIKGAKFKGIVGAKLI